MKSPAVSIVVCAHNEQKYLETCLRSILSQNFEHKIETVIVDDSSTDETWKIAEKYSKRHGLVIARNSSRLGIGASSNRGIELSSGRYVVRVDADDYVSEHFVQVLSLALRDIPGLKAARCDYTFVNQTGDHIDIRNAEEQPIACGIMMDRDALHEVGLYNSSLVTGEDVDLEHRFTERYRILRVPIPLYRYRVHPDNTTKVTI